MDFWKTHPREDLLRYLDGDVGEDEKRSLEGHLASCKDCRDYVSTVKGFNEGLTELTEEEFSSQEPCPDSWTLVSYEAGKVDEETARQLRAHLLFCDECAEEFYALRRLRGSSWTRIIIRATQRLLECVDLSGSGELLEPAYAGSPMRGGPELEPREVRIGDVVTDPKTAEVSAARVTVEADPSTARATVRFEADPPQSEWQVYLLDREEQKLASVPVARPRITLGTNLPHGPYTVQIRKGDDVLASFELEIRAPETS